MQLISLIFGNVFWRCPKTILHSVALKKKLFNLLLKKVLFTTLSPNTEFSKVHNFLFLVLFYFFWSLSQQPCGGGSRLSLLCHPSLTVFRPWKAPVSSFLVPLILQHLKFTEKQSLLWLASGWVSEIAASSFLFASLLLTVRAKIRWVEISKVGQPSWGESLTETAH